MVWCQKPRGGMPIILGRFVSPTFASHSPGDSPAVMGRILPHIARHSKAGLSTTSSGDFTSSVAL
ncbi:hypothetical protein HRbin16_01057 [bacterium HR16]|nr:hypothetical protein HRbin16_01057 [bacterium HR16]